MFQDAQRASLERLFEDAGPELPENLAATTAPESESAAGELLLCPGRSKIDLPVPQADV